MCIVYWFVVLFVMKITLGACFSGYHHSQVETDGPFWEDDRLLFGGPEAHLTFPLKLMIVFPTWEYLVLSCIWL